MNVDETEVKAHIIRPFFHTEMSYSLGTPQCIAGENLFSTSKYLVVMGIPSSPQAGESIHVQGLFYSVRPRDFSSGHSLDALDSPLPVAGASDLGTKGVQTEGLYYNFFVESLDGLQEITAIRQLYDRSWVIGESFGDQTTVHNDIVDRFIVTKALEGRRRQEVIVIEDVALVAVAL